MATTKVSVTLDDATLAWLRQRAKRVHGGNLSSAVAEITNILRKRELLRALLDVDRVPRLSPAELVEVTTQWARLAPDGCKHSGRRSGEPLA